MGRWIGQHGGGDLSLGFLLSAWAAGHTSSKPNGLVNSGITKGEWNGSPAYVAYLGGSKAGRSLSMKFYFGVKELLLSGFHAFLPVDKQQTHGVPLLWEITYSYLNKNTEPDIMEDVFKFAPPDSARKVSKTKPLFLRLQGSQ